MKKMLFILTTMTSNTYRYKGTPVVRNDDGQKHAYSRN